MCAVFPGLKNINTFWFPFTDVLQRTVASLRWFQTRNILVFDNFPFASWTDVYATGMLVPHFFLLISL